MHRGKSVVERKGLGKLAWYFEIGISSNFGDFGNFLVPPLISKNLKTQIQILKMLICRGVIISFPPSPTKAVYEMKPFMFLPVQCIADEKYHFNMTLISAFVTIQRSYTIISFGRAENSILYILCLVWMILKLIE